MIISKAGTFKLLRILAIFCAIGMGFMTLVGTSEDDATDALGVDDSFDESADVELEPVTTEKTASVTALAEGDDCDTLSVDDALDALEAEGVIEDLDKLDISSIQLEYVSGTYTTSNWDPALASITCSLTITGSQPTISIAETAINGGSGTLTVADLTDDQKAAINYYLANTDEVFTYCVVCDEGVSVMNSYSVTYDVDIGVRIKGDIDVL